MISRQSEPCVPISTHGESPGQVSDKHSPHPLTGFRISITIKLQLIPW